MNASTTTAATTVAAAPARSWKEFGKMCCAVVWSYLTLPSRKLWDLGSWMKAKTVELYTKCVYLPAQTFIATTYAFLKAMVVGLAGTAALIACLTGGLVYGGVFSGEDVKDAIVEVAPRSWVQAAYDIGIVAPYQATANADGYVRKSVGL
jgi:hypothetical protein